MIRTPLLLLLAVGALLAQDEAGVVSPDGQVEFLLGIAQPKQDTALPGLAYQVLYKGKKLIEPSYLGFDVQNQEPLLGEKVGLSKSKNGQGSGYNSVYAEYMQNGSLGRLIHVEARAFNDGVAFRYVIPPSAPLLQMFFRDEFTEFRFASDVNSAKGPLRDVSADVALAAPLPLELPGLAWVSIADSAAALSLRHYSGNILVVRLPKLASDPQLVLKTNAPWTSPWRVLAIGGTQASANPAAILGRLP